MTLKLNPIKSYQNLHECVKPDRTYCHAEFKYPPVPPPPQKKKREEKKEQCKLSIKTSGGEAPNVSTVSLK